jgi:hypothetical protein
MKISLIAFAGLSLVTLASTRGASVVIQNSQFDSPALNSGGYTGNTFTDGFTFNFAGVEYPDPSAGQFNFSGGLLPSPGTGHQYAFMNGILPTDGTSYMYQDVGALQANTTYTMTVALGWRNDQGAGAIVLGLVNGISYDPNTSVSLAASTPFVATLQGQFQDVSLTFTTGDTVSGDLTIYIQNATNGTGTGATAIDNVRLDATAVPEPTIPFLLGTFGIALMIFRGRRRSKTSGR